MAERIHVMCESSGKTIEYLMAERIRNAYTADVNRHSDDKMLNLCLV